MQDQTYIILLSKSFTGDLTPAERLSLESWIQNSPENAQFATQMKQIWESSAHHEPNITIQDLDGDYQNVLSHIYQNTNTQLKSISWRPRLLRIAAALVCLLVALWTFKQMPKGSENIIETAQGLDQRQISLPDGSTVWLRQDATLTYSNDMFNLTERRVKIQGEAYFEVTHDPTKPFRVEIGNRASVEVLGTSFDVKTSNQTSDITVILKSGKVRFKPAPKEEGIIMTPNQKLTYKVAESKINLTNIYSNADIAWQAGGLSFINAPLSQVESEIEQFYGIQITIPNQVILDCKFTSPIPSKSAEGLLKTIAAFYNLKIINTGDNNYELKGGVCSK